MSRLVRPAARKLAAAGPDAERARRLVASLYHGAQGPVRVARLAATSQGAAGAVAARMLARRARLRLLRRLTRHHDARVRAGAARALGHRGAVGGTLVAPLLTDPSLLVVRAAVRAAARHGQRQVLARLAHLALRYDRSIRAVALRALARNPGIPVARQVVVRAFLHTSPAVREDAVVAAGLAQAEWARYWLGRKVRDRSSSVRRSVARAIGRLRPTAKAFRWLAQLGRDRSPRVRKAARWARARLRRAQRALRRSRRRSLRRSGRRSR